jgi:hypothetical protein
MVDQGTSIQLTGINKVTSAQGITGAPSQSKGVYSIFLSSFNSDLGVSSSLITQPKITYANNLGISYTNGRYNMTISADLNSDRGITTSSSFQTLPKPSGAGGGTTKYYQMVGYYAAGSTYESFVVTGSPTAAAVTNPNTGHALINTYVASFWAI